MQHFRGVVDFRLLAPPPLGQTQENLTTQITHYGATRKGISGIQSSAESQDKKLDIFSRDKNVMSLDTTVDRYINCRKSDITIGLPGDLGTNRIGDATRVARTLDQFPSVKVATVYGSVVLPNNPAHFYFKSIDLETKHSDMQYDGLTSAKLAFKNDEGLTTLTAPSANAISIASTTGAITASAVVLQNLTRMDALSGEQIVVGMGGLNVTSHSEDPRAHCTTIRVVILGASQYRSLCCPTAGGVIKVGVVSRGQIIITSLSGERCHQPRVPDAPAHYLGKRLVELRLRHVFCICTRSPTCRCNAGSVLGNVDLTVPNSFAGSYSLKCASCILSISGAEGTVLTEALREKGLLTGTVSSALT